MSDKYEKLDTDGKDVADDNFERQKEKMKDILFMAFCAWTTD